MNILIINHYAGSPDFGMEFRPYYLASEWVKLGHKVNIIAADYSHLRQRQPKVRKDLQKDVIDGIDYLWIRTTSYKSSGIKRIISIILFTIKLQLRCRTIINLVNPDIVISSSTYPLDIYPSYCISRKNNAKLVFELHDLWPLSPMIIGNYSKYHPFILILQRAENFSCKKCDCYISLLGNAKEYLVNHGLNPEKFFHIPNGFSNCDYDVEKTKVPHKHSKFIAKLRKEYDILIGYIGGHAPSNAMNTFVLSAKNFINDNRIAFVSIGEGSEKEKLIQLSNELDIANIYFLSSVLKSEIPSLLQSFDVLFAGGVSSRLHHYGTSFNKIVDYMLAKKPIIFAVDETNSIVEQVECGLQIEAENEHKLIEAIKHLTSLSKSELNSIGEKGYKYASENLNYNHLAKRYLDAVNLTGID